MRDESEVGEWVHELQLDGDSSESTESYSLTPSLKVAPRRAESSEFRSILPGSALHDSYKTNLALCSTKSNHTPKASRLGRPGATYKTNFSRAVPHYTHTCIKEL